MDNQPTVSLPYLTPRERALQRVRQDLADNAIALGIVLLGLFLVFLQAGDFTAEALRALAIAAITAVVKAAITFLIHFQRARTDDAHAQP